MAEYTRGHLLRRLGAEKSEHRHEAQQPKEAQSREEDDHHFQGMGSHPCSSMRRGVQANDVVEQEERPRHSSKHNTGIGQPLRRIGPKDGNGVGRRKDDCRQHQWRCNGALPLCGLLERRCLALRRGQSPGKLSATASRSTPRQRAALSRSSGEGCQILTGKVSMRTNPMMAIRIDKLSNNRDSRSEDHGGVGVTSDCAMSAPPAGRPVQKAYRLQRGRRRCLRQGFRHSARWISRRR